MTFAEKLKELREKAGLSREQLSQASGLARGTVRDYEQGLRKPTLESAVKLASALGTDCRTFAECVEMSPSSKTSRPPKSEPTAEANPKKSRITAEGAVGVGQRSRVSEETPRLQESDMDITEAARILQQFCGQDFTSTLGGIEASAKGLTLKSCPSALAACGARDEVLVAAGLVKKLAGQINVIIHASGILVCLPKILEPDEVVQYLSLGAGNAGRPFDLETDRRIAEFKFIRWRGADAIRQNSLFKDFYQLAEHSTPKRKYVYVLGTEYPLKFLNGRRPIGSVLDKHATLLKRFRAIHGNQYETVRDYYQARGTQVVLQDVSLWVNGLIAARIDELDPTEA